MQQTQNNDSDSEEEFLGNVPIQSKVAPENETEASVSWYDKFMCFKPLGHEKFDDQVLGLI